MRELADERIGHAVREELLRRIARQILERQHGDRAECFRRAGAPLAHSEDRQRDCRGGAQAINTDLRFSRGIASVRMSAL
jgi:hypothetical protein